MRQRPDRHEIRPGVSIRPHICERDAAGCLDLDSGAQTAGLGSPHLHSRGRLVVHQKSGRPRGARLVELLQALHLHEQRRGAEPPSRREHLSQLATRDAQLCPVIVLHHHCGCEVDSVQRSAASQHRGDIQPAQAGRRLPGVQDAAFRATYRIDIRPCRRGDAGRTLQQVEQRPLRAEQRLEVARDFADDGVRAYHVALARQPPHRIQSGLGHHRVSVVAARHHTAGPELDPRLTPRAGRDADIGCDVSRPVLRQRLPCDPDCVFVHTPPLPTSHFPLPTPTSGQSPGFPPAPNATIRSTLARARRVVSGSTVMWCWSFTSASRTASSVIVFM